MIEALAFVESVCAREPFVAVLSSFLTRAESSTTIRSYPSAACALRLMLSVSSMKNGMAFYAGLTCHFNLVMVFPAAFILLRDFRSFRPALRALIICLVAWTPAIGMVTLARDIEPIRVLQMSAGLTLAGVVIVCMIWFSGRLIAENRWQD